MMLLLKHETEGMKKIMKTILNNYLIENYGKNYKLIDHVNGLETNEKILDSLVDTFEHGDDDYVDILDLLHDTIVMGLIEVKEGE